MTNRVRVLGNPDDAEECAIREAIDRQVEQAILFLHQKLNLHPLSSALTLFQAALALPIAIDRKVTAEIVRCYADCIEFAPEHSKHRRAIARFGRAVQKLEASRALMSTPSAGRA